MNDQALLAYVEQVPVPTLPPGDRVVMGSLSAHSLTILFRG